MLWPIVLPALLSAGLLTGALALANFGRPRAEPKPRREHGGSAPIAATFALLWLLCFIPGLGALGVFALLVLGIGARTAARWRRNRVAC